MKKIISLLFFISLFFFNCFEASGTDNQADSSLLSGKADGADSKWVEKVKAQYEENGTEDLPQVDPSDLPDRARAKYNEYNRMWGPDYPPVASEMIVDDKTAYIIEDQNDGGMFVEFYDKKGNLFAAGGCSESGNFEWSLTPETSIVDCKKDSECGQDEICEEKICQVFGCEETSDCTNGRSCVDETCVATDCPLTGVLCSQDCPASGNLNGSPCQKGTYNTETCECEQ